MDLPSVRTRESWAELPSTSSTYLVRTLGSDFGPLSHRATGGETWIYAIGLRRAYFKHPNPMTLHKLGLSALGNHPVAAGSRGRAPECVLAAREIM